MKFSEALAERMKKNYETNYRLAKAIGVHQTTIANWVNGQNIPQILHLVKLAEHYGVAVEDLQAECKEQGVSDYGE